MHYTTLHLRLLAIWMVSFFLLIISGILCVLCPVGRAWDLLTVTIATLGSSVFFPLTVGYIYDKVRTRDNHGSSLDLALELEKGRILWVYKNRQSASPSMDKAFGQHHRGEVKMVGVSLRVFLNDLGPHWDSLHRCLEESRGAVNVRALVSDPDAAEVPHRAEVEEVSGGYRGIREDIRITSECVSRLRTQGADIKCRFYRSAPYCTFVMFPEECFYAPNVLSRETPVLLPMMVFASDSIAYKALKDYFEYLWDRGEDCGIAGEPDAS